MTLLNSIAIIADDLTGANDTALQYFKKGYSAKIIIDVNEDFSEHNDVDILAISTESRNIGKEEAVDKVLNIGEKLKNNLNIENFYKKIDSTLRGHVGLEILATLEASKKEIALVAPAYIEENRATIGGYQLLNGIVIERTQCALDPKSPIYDSYIPDILKKDLSSQLADLIDTIELNVITKGAGPIILKINELVQKGKKIIVMDAMNNVDLEQIALAIDKSQYDILPVGSAGLASAINKTKEGNFERQTIKHIPNNARLIISGSATQLSANQIKKLKEEKKDIYFVDLTLKDVVNDLNEEMITAIKEKLNNGIDVVIHSSDINQEIKDDVGIDQLIDAGIAQNEISSKITDYLSDLIYEIANEKDPIIIIVGGETSYKCTKKLNSKYLEILDVILPAIPLCIDTHGRIIATKSGNFGTTNTLVEILNYFDRLKNV